VPGQAAASGGHAIAFGTFRLLPQQRVLLEDGRPLRLGSRALDILVALAEHPGAVISKDELIARVWPDTVVEETSLRVHIAALRRALRDGRDGNRYVATIAGRGYCFVADVSQSDIPAETLPPAASAQPAPHSLPAPLTPIVGRADTVASLAAQLPARRFVTMVGPGGIGKTTVALAVGAQVAPSYAHGVRFVDLAPLADPLLVPSALASALGLASHTENPVPGLLAFLSGRQMLLVLDSCERVIDAAAVLVEGLLKAAPGLHVLATSREPLRAEGERVHRLAPLASPHPDDTLTAAEALAFPAVQLFAERAAAILDGFELSDAEAPLVADICRRLDGIALAIELAAGRLDTVRVRELAAGLDDRFRLLTRGRRTALPRHRTLTAMLDWSYEILPASERAALRRLAVFAGSFTLESARAVAGGAEASGPAVLDQIANLVGKSLVTADFEAAVPLYRLLDTTRAYALQKLVDSGELESVARRHAEHCRDLLERAERQLSTQTATEWLATYGRQIDDVRAALAWAFSSSGDTEIAVALTLAAVPLWTQLLLLQECRDRIEKALVELDPDANGTHRARMHLSAALGAVQLQIDGASPAMRAAWAATLAMAEHLGDGDYQLRGVWGLLVSSMSGPIAASLTLAHRFHDLAAASPDAADRSVGDRLIGNLLHLMGDQTGARQHVERFLGNYPKPADRSHLTRFHFDHRVVAMSTLAQVLWLQGHPNQALQVAGRAVEEARSIDHTVSLFYALTRAACPVAIAVGDLGAAQNFVSILNEHAVKHRPWSFWEQAFNGLLLIRRGYIADGLGLLHTGRDGMAETSFAARYAAFAGVLAEALALTGSRDQAMVVIERSLAQSDRKGERWYSAELLRIKADIVATQGTSTAAREAEALLLHSLEIAREQTALAWEVRTATSLARLLRS
jgi:predicted ATPase/DNA-binding winged helix-turn-helix (wHTH) protein